MMLACGAAAATGGSWTMLAIIAAPVLGLMLGSVLLRRPTTPPTRGPSAAPRADLPEFPLATRPSLEPGTAGRDERDDELVGV